MARQYLNSFEFSPSLGTCQAAWWVTGGVSPRTGGGRCTDWVRGCLRRGGRTSHQQRFTLWALQLAPRNTLEIVRYTPRTMRIAWHDRATGYTWSELCAMINSASHYSQAHMTGPAATRYKSGVEDEASAGADCLDALFCILRD